MSHPSRRTFIKTIGALAATGAMPLFFCKKNSPSNEPLRNVICIIGDDHSANVVGCYGNNIIRTPNLDRLAGQGVKFTNAFSQAPLCSASRQSILTGKYPHATGVTLLRTSFPDEHVTIAEHLKQFGYSTGLIGKSHFNNNLAHGFDYRIGSAEYYKHLEQNPPKQVPGDIKTRPKWRPFRVHARIWLNSEMLPEDKFDQDTETTFLTEKAIGFLQENVDNPFCLWIGYHEPHSPFNFPVEYLDKYKPKDMPLPEGSPEDDRWIPLVFKDLTDDEKRGIIASYYTSVEYLDSKVGQILDELDKLGLDKNTLVIYIGDQGYLLGDHKRFEKHTMWDPAIRAPLIMRMGKRGQDTQTVDALTEFVDIAPTILDALDIPPMGDVQGKSFLPVVKGEKSEYKEIVFSEFLVDNKAMVRTKEWKYIFTTGARDMGQGYATGNPPSGILHRLYHVKNDPDETTNVADKPENQAILTEMKDMMLTLFKETHPKADQLPVNLSVEQQLVWFCEPPDEGAELDAK